MSFQAMAWAARQKVDDPLAKWLLVLLADHADKLHHRCYPSISHLARESEMSERSVLNKLSLLEEKGLITRHQRSKDGLKLCTVYELPGGTASGAVVPQEVQEGTAPRAHKPITDPSSSKEEGADAPQSDASRRAWEHLRGLDSDDARKLRPLIGKALGRADLTHELVESAVLAVIAEQPLDPVPFFQKALSAQKKTAKGVAEQGLPARRKNTCDFCDKPAHREHPRKPWVKLCRDHAAMEAA